MALPGEGLRQHLTKVRQQLVGRRLQRSHEAQHRGEAHLALAPLDARDLHDRQTGRVCQVLLGRSPTVTRARVSQRRERDRRAPRRIVEGITALDQNQPGNVRRPVLLLGREPIGSYDRRHMGLILLAVCVAAAVEADGTLQTVSIVVAVLNGLSMLGQMGEASGGQAAGATTLLNFVTSVPDWGF
jgi:hypothetical protein